MLLAALEAAYSTKPIASVHTVLLATLLFTTTLPLPPDFSIAGRKCFSAKATLLELV
jgi:hypothetical protein